MNEGEIRIFQRLHLTTIEVTHKRMELHREGPRGGVPYELPDNAPVPFKQRVLPDCALLQMKVWIQQDKSCNPLVAGSCVNCRYGPGTVPNNHHVAEAKTVDQLVGYAAHRIGEETGIKRGHESSLSPGHFSV